MMRGATLIIAEAGVNHNGSIETAGQLIETAAEAGADLVKFQTFSADRLVTGSASKADYQLETTSTSESQHEMIRKLELSREMHEELIAHCKKCGVGFFSTGFDPQSVDLLAELGLDRFKIPSGEITNLPYLRHIGQYGKPVILSTGMARLGEIEAALEVLEASEPHGAGDGAALQHRVSHADGRCEPEGDAGDPGCLGGAGGLLRSHLGHRGADRSGSNGGDRD